jgi:hypothetical protein
VRERKYVCPQTKQPMQAEGRLQILELGFRTNDQTLSEKSLLLSCKEMSAVNHRTARTFSDATQTVWPDRVKSDSVLLQVTHAAPYMKNAAEGPSVSYTKLIHTTCVSHALPRVCETIRVLYPNADKSGADGKKIFRKSPARIAPETPLPPAPVFTRWGTWLDAIVCCTENV